MSSLLASTMNTRALPTGSMRFLRSDAPVALTPREIDWLKEQGVTTLVDLRAKEEVLRKPCCLQDHPDFRYVHLPVTGGGNTPASREHLHAVYAGMIDGQMDRILETILTAPGGVMYFCTAGKDRTGVVSALLLRRLGYPDDVIIRDYMLSKDNLMPMLTAHVQTHPEVDLDIIVPREENLTRLLANL